jgi:hypothetical protein
MKVLLFLNGLKGSQYGIEDGFNSLLLNKRISKLSWFYFEDVAEKESIEIALEKMLILTNEFIPNLIVFFHIGNFPINIKFMKELRNISSKPLIVYDEGDMYGSWAKPITKSMRILFKSSDLISIRGLGDWLQIVKKYNSNIVYTPHSNSLNRISSIFSINSIRKKEFLFIGNRVTSRLGFVRRLPGASDRESLLKFLYNSFPDKVSIYGLGWEKIFDSKGKLEFKKQTMICNEYWFHISYEHYPSIPYYFSDRLPISLASGQIYICHYHKGYDEIFKGTDFIYFFKSKKELIDIMTYLLSLSHDQLNVKSMNAKKWVANNLSPNIVWGNLLDSIVNLKFFRSLSQ